MKTRTGFVSNSSSSSFILLCKEGELTKEIAKTIFHVSTSSVLKGLSEKMAEVLVTSAKKSSLKELMEDYDWDNIEDAPKEWQEILRSKQGIIYTGSFCDEDEYEEAVMCMMEINYKDRDIIMIKEGGY